MHNGANPPDNNSARPMAWLDPFVWRMAWRDTRTSRSRLLVFALAMVIGVAAIAGVAAFGENLHRAIEDQSRSLLGADLVISSRRPFAPGHRKIFESFRGQMSEGANLSAMVTFPQSNNAGRLVQLRAIGEGFPFYGELVTDPPQAKDSFRKNGALVEETLLAQFGAKVGDTIKLGTWTGVVAGKLLKVPGETIVFGALAPRVYISTDTLKQTSLLRPQSLVRFRMNFRLPDNVPAEELLEQVGGELQGMRFTIETVKQRREELGQSMANLNNFLNLSGFIALLLGGIAVGTALQLHIRQKLATVATLRCLGVEAERAFAIYLLQALVIGAACAFLGASLGVGIQRLLPDVMRDFLPFPVTFQFFWAAIGKACLFGLIFCGLFALLPLLPVRRIAPLAALRRGWEENTGGLNWAQVLISLGLLVCVLRYAVSQTQKWQIGAGMVGGLIIAVGLLALVAQSLRYLARKFSQTNLPFVWRQGLASLHRPNNRTLVLLLSLGLGTFLLLTLRLTEYTMLHGILPHSEADRPNAVLFDIQPDQKEGVRKVLEGLDLKIMQEAPVVTMRLQSIRGRTVETLLKDDRSLIPAWTLRREYRSSYRDNLGPSESILRGQWPPAPFDATKFTPISVDEGIAKELQVDLGDEMVFDVQGLPMKTKISAIRKVDWRRMEPNFFMIFPSKVLEDAPSFHIFATYVATPQISARMQSAVLQKYANVSVIDLTLIIHTLDDILKKVAAVVRFMSLFTVAAGVIVLAGTLLAARYQRVQESVLLRTLGASRQQVQQIQAVEYLCLGFLAALAAILLALGANAALSWWVFKTVMVIDWMALGFTVVLLPAFTLIAGWLTNRGVANHPPLEILRHEA